MIHAAVPCPTPTPRRQKSTSKSQSRSWRITPHPVLIHAVSAKSCLDDTAHSEFNGTRSTDQGLGSGACIDSEWVLGCVMT